MTVTTNDFTYHAPTKTFVAEASRFGLVFELNRLHPLSHTRGLFLESARTGVVLTYELVETKYNADDLAVWILKPTAEAVRRAPSCEGTQVHILND